MQAKLRFGNTRNQDFRYWFYNSRCLFWDWQQHRTCVTSGNGTWTCRMYGLAVMLSVATLNICQILMRFGLYNILQQFYAGQSQSLFVYSWTLTVPRSHVESSAENIPHISSISFTASIRYFSWHYGECTCFHEFSEYNFFPKYIMSVMPEGEKHWGGQ